MTQSCGSAGRCAWQNRSFASVVFSVFWSPAALGRGDTGKLSAPGTPVFGALNFGDNWGAEFGGPFLSFLKVGV